MTKLSVRATRAVTWAATVAVSLGMAMPAFAWQQLPRSMVYEFQSQSGTVEGDAHVVRADAGDEVDMSLTVINRSQNPAGKVWYGADALTDEVAPYQGGHEIRVGTLQPMDGTPDFLDESSFMNDNHNRFATYNGAAVFPGQTMTLSWKVKIASDTADGTYDMHYGLLREHDEWGTQWKNGANLGSADIFTRFIIGQGGASGNLEGGAGSIEDADWVSSLSGEKVGEDAEDVEVAGLDIDADSGSDINLTAVRLDFSHGTADQDFEDYATEVSLWFDDEEVGRWDADEFTDDNNYDKTVSLEEDAIIRAGDTGRLVVAVSGVGNIDTNDLTETWTVEFESIRFEDGQGAVITDSATGDINGVTRTFSFESFATSEDIELKISKMTGDDADEINDAHLINVHATNKTNGVKILAFTLEAEGNSDLEIRDFGVDIVVANASHVDDVITGGTSPAVRLIIDGEEYGTATYNEDVDGFKVGVDEEIHFSNVDYTLEADDKVDAYIEVDLNDTTGAVDADDMDEGDTIYAQITETQTADTALVDVRDETNTRLADADITGSATSAASEVYNQVFTMASTGWKTVSVTHSDTATIDESVTFEITLNITAVDGDIYIDDVCTADVANGPASTDGLAWGVTNYADFDGGAAIVPSCTMNSNATDAGAAFLVPNGQTKYFTLTTNVTALDASDFAQVWLAGIGWSEALEDADRLFAGNLATDYRSESVFINNRP